MNRLADDAPYAADHADSRCREAPSSRPSVARRRAPNRHTECRRRRNYDPPRTASPRLSGWPRRSRVGCDARVVSFEPSDTSRHRVVAVCAEGARALLSAARPSSCVRCSGGTSPDVACSTVGTRPAYLSSVAGDDCVAGCGAIGEPVGLSGGGVAVVAVLTRHAKRPTAHRVGDRSRPLPRRRAGGPAAVAPDAMRSRGGGAGARGGWG